MDGSISATIDWSFPELGRLGTVRDLCVSFSPNRQSGAWTDAWVGKSRVDRYLHLSRIRPDICPTL